MKVQVIDEAALASPQPRNVRLYLRIHGWAREPRREGEPDIWTLPTEDGAYEVIAPSSHRAFDYPRRIAELLRTVSIAENRSELELLRDLVTLTFDIQQIHGREHGGPPGTAPLRDAAVAFNAAQSMIASALTSFEQRRLVLPTRRPPRAAELMSRVLTGPATEGSYVIAVWVPVPPRLRPNEDGILFEPEEFDPNEPYERSATKFLNRALTATREAAIDTLSGDFVLESFARRQDEGVSANLCESLVNLSGQEGTAFDVRFSWALERPVQELAPVVRFGNETIPVLREAAQALRSWIPEDDVTIRGNVVRLHREGNYGAE